MPKLARFFHPFRQNTDLWQTDTDTGPQLGPALAWRRASKMMARAFRRVYCANVTVQDTIRYEMLF